MKLIQTKLLAKVGVINIFIRRNEHKIIKVSTIKTLWKSSL